MALQLNLKQDQKLVMTPQLQMAIKLLQMSTMDVHAFVGAELNDNPFLSSDSESGDTASNSEGSNQENSDKQNNDSGDGNSNESATPLDASDALASNTIDDSATGLDMSLDNMYDSGSSPSVSTTSSSNNSTSDEMSSMEDNRVVEKTLTEFLYEQLEVATQDAVLQFLGKYLIDEVDESGYLHVDFEEIAEQLNVNIDKLKDALSILQGFEPSGVGARSLQECLRLQLGQSDMPRAMFGKADTILDNLDLLAKQDFKKLAKLASCSQDEVMEICGVITTLNPKPGLQYGGEVTKNIIPDVVVSKNDQGQWKVVLNAEAMPKILINNALRGMTKTARGKDKEYINERMNRAQWLINSLEQRVRTILKVTNEIVKSQVGFFDYGAENLAPMTLKMVADKVDVHESTVSRVTNGKYMQTPMGVFELKYFFSSAIGTTGGNMQVASESVRHIIKRLIGEENPAKPFSDEQLVKLLKSEGVDIARRTVAKYRDSLNIASSSKRKI